MSSSTIVRCVVRPPASLEGSWTGAATPIGRPPKIRLIMYMLCFVQQSLYYHQIRTLYLYLHLKNKEILD